MEIKPSDYEFNNTKICHIQPKLIDLDRVLINLYILLKYDGRRPVMRSGRKEVTVQFIVDQLLRNHQEDLPGFADKPDVVKDWIHSDLLDVVYRGKPDKEKIAAPLPLHLNAYKLRNPTIAKDYRGAEHLYSMLRAGDPSIIIRLKTFLAQGMDRTGDYDRYDGETPLDLDTMTIVRMVDSSELKEEPSGDKAPLDDPLCIGQARLFTDDLRRLLVYEKYVPRSVMIGYLHALTGFHLGLYLLRLFRQLSGWVRDHQANHLCQKSTCPVKPSENALFLECPYAFQNPNTKGVEYVPELIVDMGEDPSSRMAQMSMDSCAGIYETMNDYIHGVFTTNRLFQFVESYAFRSSSNGNSPHSVQAVLELLKHQTEKMNSYFSNRIDDLFPDGMEDERAEVKAILDIKELSPLETFVELVALERTYNYRRELTRQLDSVFMKNLDSSLLRQGKGKKNRRRWYIGSRLLELLVQIAVLKPFEDGNQTKFVSQPILIVDFITWLRNRYGIVIMPDRPDAPVEDNMAFNQNMQNLKRRLREIGFYTDLSDAYNTQTIRPRYSIGEQEGA